jgi:hypothetical protein
MTFFGENVSVPGETTAAGWISDRIGAFGSVGGLIPSGFDVYIAIDHATPDDPEPYRAPEELIARLGSIAVGHTETPASAWFGIWVGYGWTSTRTLIATNAPWRDRRRIRRSEEERSARVQEQLEAIPRFGLPGRDYFLLAGPVESAAQIEPAVGRPHPPDLWWPEDRAWFIATDTDLSWSYLGGTAELVGEVVAAHPARTKPVDWSSANAAVQP